MSQAKANEAESQKILIEVCIASAADAVAACEGGADRLELNQALELGGLTPTCSLLEQVLRAVPLPVIAMIRPRAAGFRYSTDEKRLMLDDAKRLLDAGAAGIASGALLENASLDVDFWGQLTDLVQGREIVFHRAIDVVVEPTEVLAQLVDSGCTRVLTSGGKPTACLVPFGSGVCLNELDPASKSCRGPESMVRTRRISSEKPAATSFMVLSAPF